jgi:hypothetical protein
MKYRRNYPLGEDYFRENVRYLFQKYHHVTDPVCFKKTLQIMQPSIVFFFYSSSNFAPFNVLVCRAIPFVFQRKCTFLNLLRRAC